MKTLAPVSAKDRIAVRGKVQNFSKWKYKAMSHIFHLILAQFFICQNVSGFYSSHLQTGQFHNQYCSHWFKKHWFLCVEKATILQSKVNTV